MKNILLILFIAFNFNCLAQEKVKNRNNKYIPARKRIKMEKKQKKRDAREVRIAERRAGKRKDNKTAIYRTRAERHKFRKRGVVKSN